MADETQAPEDHGDGDDTQAVRQTFQDVPPEEVPASDEDPDAEDAEVDDNG